MAWSFLSINGFPRAVPSSITFAYWGSRDGSSISKDCVIGVFMSCLSPSQRAYLYQARIVHVRSEETCMGINWWKMFSLNSSVFIPLPVSPHIVAKLPSTRRKISSLIPGNLSPGGKSKITVPAPLPSKTFASISSETKCGDKCPIKIR